MRVSIEARPEPIEIDTGSTAALVIDMQNDFGSKGGMFDRAGIDVSPIRSVIGPTATALAALRSAAIAVVYLKMGFRPDLSDAGPPGSPNRIKHAAMSLGARLTAPDGRESRSLVRDTWNTDILAELAPHAGDVVLYKTRYSGFYGTGLDSLLEQRAVDTLIITGCTTSVCVESTIRDAMFRDIRCILLADCTAEPIGGEFARTNHEASLFVIEALFGWVSTSSEVVRALA